MKKMLGLILTLMVVLLTACQPGITDSSSVIFKSLPSFAVYQYDEDFDFMEGVIIESKDGENLNHLATVDLSEFSSLYLGNSIIYYRVVYQGKNYEKFHLVEIVERPVVDVYFTVNFDSNGGSLINSLDVLKDSTISQSPEPTRSDYSFEGWYLDQTFLTEFRFGIDVVQNDLTLYAKWTLNDVYYTVSFETNGGNVINSLLILEGSTVDSIEEPFRTNYRFAGWYLDQNFITEFKLGEDSVDTDLTLYVKWTLVEVYYTVSFESNGGSDVNSVAVLADNLLDTIQEPIRTGYTFIGWYKESDLLNIFNFSTDLITSDLTLYAKWTQDDIYYTVSFETNGGTAIDSISVLEGSLIVMQAETQKNNHIFDGWYSDESYITLFNFNEDIVESDITLYAKWIVDPDVIEEEIQLNIFYLNDLHGAILEASGSLGLANIANLIIDEKENNPENTIFISGGDMLQGQVISNYYTGASVIDLLNQMELDAFVMGNHEFDWGLESVLQYFNGENVLQANYPILGANIYSQTTDEMIDVLEPYTIIERSGLKIAIIGTIGYGIESSISYPRVQPYYFYNPIELTGYYAEQARLEGADIVLAVNHMDDASFNTNVAKLSGNQKVDAIFNGHTHYNYVRSAFYNNRQIHTIQSGANGSHVGKVSLTYNTLTESIQSTAVNLTQNNDVRLSSPHPMIEASIETYVEGVYSLLYDSYMPAGEDMSRGTLATYIASLMQKRFNADVGLHNYGGTRTDIKMNEPITYSKLFQISPFDNQVILATVKGSVLKSNVDDYNAAYRTGLTYGSIVDDHDYVIATNDYIFYDKYSPFKTGTNIEVTEVLVLDLFVEVIENLKDAGYITFYINLPINFDEPQPKHYALLPTKFSFIFA